MSNSRYVTGLRAVEQLLASSNTEVSRIFAEYRSANPRVEALLVKAREAGIDIQSANRARLQQMSGEARHQGIIAEVRRTTVLDEAGLRSLVEEKLSAGEQPLLLMLDGVQDPHNLGACLRTADATGVDAVIIPKDRSAGLTAAVRKVAAGGAESVPLLEVTNITRCLKDMKKAGIWIYGTSEAAMSTIYEYDYVSAVALVMGTEGDGLRRLTAEQCDHLIKLPMQGVVESLNVSVAAGVCLYEILRSRMAQGHF
jgi:23S rRNA (guanosine2251-2'-O)-methyltransferase